MSSIEGIAAVVTSDLERLALATHDLEHRLRLGLTKQPAASRLTILPTSTGRQREIERENMREITQRSSPISFAGDGATRVVWIADFLPEEVASNQQAAMDAAFQVMKTTLDRLAENQSDAA